MGQESKIEWTHHTFNPWWGCTKVSPGCKHCYAETLATRWDKDVWGPKKPRRMMSEAYWKQPERWNREAEAEGVRKRVFCASMADVFEGQETMPEESWEAVDSARWRLFRLIEDTPNLDWQLLTKRPENVIPMVKPFGFSCDGSLPPNIWLGASVESQKEADERIPHLQKIPAKVRFLSCEPLIGSVELKLGTCINCRHAFHAGDCYNMQSDNDCSCHGSPRISWVICGGESGHGARPMHPDFARSLRDQCAAAGVPFFFKQWGEFEHGGQFVSFNEWVNKATSRLGKGFSGVCIDRAGNKCAKGEDFQNARDKGLFPVDYFFKVGKKRAGRLLDGREWNEFPGVA